MVKKTVQRRGRARRSNPPLTMSGRDTTIVVNFKHTSTATANATANVGISPANFGPFLVSIADSFEMFQFINLQINVIPLAITAGSMGTIGYFKTIPSTPPTTPENVLNAVASRLISTVITTPQRLSLSKRDLTGGARVMYNCQAPTGVSADDLNQGILYFSSSTAGFTFVMEFSGLCKFRGRSNTNVN